MQSCEHNDKLHCNFYIRPKKRNCLFPVTVRKKNRVGRSVKMCVLCMFHLDWELDGR